MFRGMFRWEMASMGMMLGHAPPNPTLLETVVTLSSTIFLQKWLKDQPDWGLQNCPDLHSSQHLCDVLDKHGGPTWQLTGLRSVCCQHLDVRSPAHPQGGFRAAAKGKSVVFFPHVRVNYICMKKVSCTNMTCKGGPVRHWLVGREQVLLSSTVWTAPMMSHSHEDVSPVSFELISVICRSKHPWQKPLNVEYEDWVTDLHLPRLYLTRHSALWRPLVAEDERAHLATIYFLESERSALV